MTSAFRQSTAFRSIPAMRSSYDGEHPVAPTPIYDALYSEYRRLFRALPGDRSGEEELRFTGFASRPYEPRADYAPPSAVDSYAASSQHQPFHAAPQFTSAHPHPQAPQQYQTQQSHQAQHPHQPHSHQQHQSPGQNQAQIQAPQQHPHPAPPQPTGGQGWVAAGYLAPTTVQPPGRHRGNLLSLPPGRS